MSSDSLQHPHIGSDVLESLLDVAHFTPLADPGDTRADAHARFAYWLVRHHRPRVVVESGDRPGAAYFAFCQAVQEAALDTRCYAIDLWHGSSAAHDDDAPFSQAQAHNLQHYRAFSGVLRMSPLEADEQFPEGSIDLLHLNSGGPDDFDIAQSFASWLPRMAPGGLVLLHGIDAASGAPNMVRLWSTLRRKHSCHMEFLHDQGLGILQLCDQDDARCLPWLRPGSALQGRVRSYFHGLSMQQAAARKTNSEGTEKNTEAAPDPDTLLRLTRERETLQQRIDALELDRQRHVDALATVTNTLSWRMTAGLRWLNGSVTGRGKPQRNPTPAPAFLRWAHRAASHGVMALCLLPATFFQYRPFSAWLSAARGGRSFFTEMLRDPTPALGRLARRPRWLRLPISVGVSAAMKLAYHGGLRPVVRGGLSVMRKEGLRGLWVRLKDREPPPRIVVAKNAYPERVLVADFRIPMEDVSAGERATMGLLRNLRRFGYEVTLLPNNMAGAPRYEAQLEALGIQVITREKGYGSTVDYVSRHGHEYGVFYFIRVEVAEPLLDIARRAAPGARVIFHAPDLHFLREDRETEITQDEATRERARHTRERELAVMRASDHVVVVSPAESALLQALVPDSPVSVFPALYTPVVPEPAPFDARRNLFFLGGFEHRPNVHGVLWFANEVWPLVRQTLGDLEFHIVGSNTPASVKELEQLPGVRVLGYVEDLKPVLDSMRLGVAPLHYGAGIKGKVAMTLGAGVPCICTSIAAEGMYLRDEEDVLRADDAASFAAAIVRAYTDPELWQQLSANGQAVVNRHFSSDANRRSLLNLLNRANALPFEMYARYCAGLTPVPAIPVVPDTRPVDASIIIPAYNQWPLTRSCILSILEVCAADNITYELILADDCSTDETLNAAEHFPGLIISRTETNQGFLRNCNQAARMARGRHILLLNNDTVVLPGWLPALVDTLDTQADAAIVGSKIMYLDGTIQEAGGQLFNDGTAMNAGRGKSPLEPVLNFAREVDYITGCSILVRKSFWDAVGGFDERYRTAYCEDSDLAMTARSLGMRVLYQPASEVVHYEHQTYGRQETSNTELQAHNIAVLRDKWKDAFARDHLPPGTPAHLVVANAERRPSPAALQRRREGRLNILYFTPFPSHPTNHGNRTTINEFGRYFQQQGHAVHFALLAYADYFTERDIEDMRAAWDTFDLLPFGQASQIYPEGIPYDAWYQDGLGEAVRILCARYDIDLVFCSYIFQSKLLEYVPAHILKVIDTHDKMGGRYEMLRANGQPLEFFSCTPEEEGAYLRRADVVVARRAEEADYFDSVSGRDTAIVIPHVEAPRFLDRGFEQLYRVGLVASANRINLALMREFLESLDRQLKGAAPPFTVHIAGQVKDMVADLPEAQQAVFRRPWVTLLGFVDSIADFYDAMDLIVSPVTMGTGINVKTVQAMAFGMPLITTAWGSKGIESGEPMHMHQDLDSLAGSLLALASRPHELNPLAAVSRRCYTTFYENSISGFHTLLTHPKLLDAPATAPAAGAAAH